MRSWQRCALLAGVLAVGAAGSASAATIHVTTKKDEFGAGGTPKCALREAVEAANKDAKFGGCPKGQGADTIVLGRGVHKLSIVGTGEDDNADGDLDTRATVTIRGQGRGKTTIDGGGYAMEERILERVQGNLTVAKLTLRNANANDSEYYGAAVGVEESSANNGTLTLRGVSVEDNYAYYSGGGIYVDYGNLRLLNSRVVDNAADDDGGGIYFNSTDGKLTIKRSQIAGNYADDGPGGIAVYADNARTSIDRTVIRDNWGDDGGGLYLEGQTATIKRSTIASNFTPSDEGGGIYIYSVQEPVLIDSTTVAGNHGNYYGGGLWVGSPLIVRNSTIARNVTYYSGGGIYAEANVRLLNSTVARNWADDYGGGIYNDGVTFEHRNTIIARNHVEGDSGLYEDCGGTTTISLGNNLLGDGSCDSVGSDLAGSGSVALDPRLKPLGKYGGPTQTLALMPGSPAIDKGKNCLARDQRGKKRTGKCDIGAFER